MKVKLAENIGSSRAKRSEIAYLQTIQKPDQESRQALSVPSSAVIFDNSQYYVLVYHNKSDVKITPIKYISAVGKTTFIGGGVNVGDKIISSQAILIYNALNS